MSEAADNALEFVTTADLVDELQRRHIASIVVVLGKTAKSDRATLRSDYYSGGWHTCLGMLESFRHEMLNKGVTPGEDDVPVDAREG